MKNRVIIVFLISFLVACSSINKEELYLLGQLKYEEETSVRKVKSEDYRDSPKKEIRKATVLKGANVKIVYSTVRTSKRDAQGPFILAINSTDTIISSEADYPYEMSEYSLSGRFSSSKSKIPINHLRKQMVFNTDGICIESWVQSSSDSGNSTYHERMGEYRMKNDTIHVTFYRSRALYSGFRPQIKWEDVQWSVSKPASYQLQLTTNSDSLLQYNTVSESMSLFLVSQDSMLVLGSPEE